MIFFGGGIFGNSEWGDYDGDGDLDFIVNGKQKEHEDAITQWRNELTSLGFPSNHPPDPPAGLDFVLENNDVLLIWSPSQDDHTPSSGLTYNVRIGSVPGGQDITPSLSHLSDGRRLVPESGNAGSRRNYWINDLPPGTYYWSVQAVDNSFLGSAFASEQTFTVAAD